MKKLWIALAVIISGLCWYFSFDLSGDYGYLLWFAPIPVLLVSFYTSAKQTFVIAGTAYLIGRLSWLSYLLTVLPVVMAIVFTILFPLIFASIAVLTRKIVVVKQSKWSVFAFPVLWSLFEFILCKFSADGTAGSIAYSESNLLPLIQVASLTGILGITFLVTLFPSAVAVAIYCRHNKKFLLPSVISFLLILISILYGVVRMNSTPPGQTTMTAGLAVVDEKFHSETNNPKPGDEIHVADLYAEEISKLARQGAQVIVLPEKMVNITATVGFPVKSIIANAATNNHVIIVAGYTEFTNDSIKQNMALVVSKGNLLADYQKVNLFEGEAMNGFVPGNKTATFSLNNIPSGVAICKDLDYQDFIRTYTAGKIQVLFVPAWDFITDGWLHSRMAILRGVENGLTIIRTARQGQLTISDYRGKVLYEASCTNNKAVSLIATVSLQPIQTFYSRFGDWFGYINTIAAIYFLFLLIRKQKQNLSV